jgi:hypothetical protein
MKNIYLLMITFSTVMISVVMISLTVQLNFQLIQRIISTQKDYDSINCRLRHVALHFINVLMGEIASIIHLPEETVQQMSPGYQQIDQMTHSPVNANLKQLGIDVCRCTKSYLYWNLKNKIDFKEKSIIVRGAF